MRPNLSIASKSLEYNEYKIRPRLSVKILSFYRTAVNIFSEEGKYAKVKIRFDRYRISAQLNYPELIFRNSISCGQTSPRPIFNAQAPHFS